MALILLILSLFNEDPDTYAVIMIGEIGGTAEEEAAEWVIANMNKTSRRLYRWPNSPSRKADGPCRGDHLWGKGTAAEKIKTMEACGIRVAATPSDMGETLIEALKANGLYEKSLTHETAK